MTTNRQVLNGAIFEESYSEMVVVKDIELLERQQVVLAEAVMETPMSQMVTPLHRLGEHGQSAWLDPIET